MSMHVCVHKNVSNITYWEFKYKLENQMNSMWLNELDVLSENYENFQRRKGPELQVPNVVHFINNALPLECVEFSLVIVYHINTIECATSEFVSMNKAKTNSQHIPSTIFGENDENGTKWIGKYKNLNSCCTHPVFVYV